MPIFTIKDYIEDADLREVCWQHAFLYSVLKEYALRSGECVIFENATRTKARLVANVGGMPILLIPPIDPQKQLSVHLEVNCFLKSPVWGPRRAVAAQLESREEDLEARLVARDALRKKAAARRRAERKAG